MCFSTYFSDYGGTINDGRRQSVAIWSINTRLILQAIDVKNVPEKNTFKNVDKNVSLNLFDFLPKT